MKRDWSDILFDFTILLAVLLLASLLFASADKCERLAKDNDNLQSQIIRLKDENVNVFVQNRKLENENKSLRKDVNFLVAHIMRGY